MHILLTRPLEDCHEMILKFQSLGHDVSHLPLINIEGNKINLEVELFSLDGSKRFHLKSSESMDKAEELGIEMGKTLKKMSNNSYKK